MKTIKLPYKTTKYSNVIRYSYNRFLEGKTEKEIRKLTKSLKLNKKSK